MTSSTPVRREPADRLLSRPGSRRGVGGLPRGQDRACGARRALRAGRRPLPGTGEPTDMDSAARRSRHDAQVGVAARRRSGGAGAIPGGLHHTDRRSLASNGIDAQPARSFDDYDRATEISFERETWSMVKGRSTFTAAYHAPGGPDVWWSARADHTLTRLRIIPGSAPTTTVLLTTLSNPSTPRGFSCLYGGQRAALLGESPVTDRHYELPIGSAGVLVGETADRYPVYMPFDDVDVSINLGDARLFTQFVVRSAAAGAAVTLGPQFEEFAGYISARIGQGARIAWPNSTTYLGPHPGIGRVMLRSNFIDTPRHKQLPIQLINPREESRYQMALV